MNQIHSPYQSQLNSHQLHSSQALYNATGPSQPAYPQTPLGPQSRFQQFAQQQNRHAAAFGPNPNGGMNQSGYQQPTSSASTQPNAFTSAGYSQSTPAPAQAIPHTVSPPNYVPQSPSAHSVQLGPKFATPKHSMAAPPAPNVAQVQSPHSTTNSSSAPQSPHSATSQGREKERVTLLLDINVELLQEINNLQAQGKGGAQSAQQVELFKKQGLPDLMASEDFIQTLHRLHANLGYLCGQSDIHVKPGQKPPHPPHFMKPPPNMPALEGKYAALRMLFPGWVGRDGPSNDHMNGFTAPSIQA